MLDMIDQGMTDRQIGAALCRTAHSVMSKRRRLGAVRSMSDRESLDLRYAYMRRKAREDRRDEQRRKLDEKEALILSLQEEIKQLKQEHEK